ncbi:MAG: DUF3122 domain-containing protein [Calothrix sp. MO_167.B12]|nr:DUF3122 domain-containing protein [Calothrix sp. MO_167.B12]
MNTFTHQVRHMLTWLLLVGLFTLLAFLGLGIFLAPPAAAVITEHEYVPGTIIYQSRQSLRDVDGQPWQAIAFKGVSDSGSSNFSLRLVGFPGTVTLDRSQPLTLKSARGKILTAPDTSQEIFTESTAEPHIVQYNLQPILSQLQPEQFWVVQISTVDNSQIEIKVPSWMIQEWQIVAAKKSSTPRTQS